ncbi:MAG: GNAT family N-acetyltransferase [Treponema sp.]|nr:MAG: GNAT family N-acetyltransferase [Treponema sp.]
MEFIYEEDRIYSTNEIGSVIAEITFPEVSEDVLELKSTFVNRLLRGQGIASDLMKEVVEFAKRKNKKIKPVCSYAVKWFEKHDEYKDVLYTD